MHAAAKAFVERKFGAEGAYDAGAPVPWSESARVKATVAPYDDEFVDCLADMARYVHAKDGKFPGNRSTIVLSGFVQAHHLDVDFYDTHDGDGAYLATHAEHLAHWHDDG